MVIQRPHRIRYRRRGGAIVVVAVVTPLLLGFAALAVDVGLMYCMDAETQNAVDAAALAGASGLSEIDTTTARQRATDFLSPNLIGRTGAANTSIIDIGTWNETTRAFLPNGAVTNAIRVSATRNDAPIFFGAVLGWTKYNMTRSAVAMLTPRDIAVAIDLSGSMNDDSELRHYRDFSSESGGTRPGVQINLKDVWIALPSGKGYNGVANGANPGTPGAATANNNQPSTGSGQPQRVVGHPDSGNEPSGGSANPGGPRWGWMTGWGIALVVDSYDPTADAGLYYVPSGSTCTDADVIANLTQAGYSSAERTVLLSGSNDDDEDDYVNRVKVCLGLAGWRSGKSGGKYTSGGDGDGKVDSNELTSLVPWPFDAGSWDAYVSYVAADDTKMYDTNDDFRYRYGIKTTVNYLLEKISGYSQVPELAATPELPLQSVKDAVQLMANILDGLGGSDHLALEIFASTGRHEVNLTHDYQSIPDRLAAMQSNYYDNSTNIGGGLDKAITELTSSRARPHAKKVIILMTDGKPNIDQSNSSASATNATNWALNRAQLAADNDITIFTIAVGGDADRSVTQSVASIGQGEEFFAGATPEEYTPQLQTIFQHLGGKQFVHLVK